MNIFKKLFLKEGTLAIMPENGYEKADKSSDMAVKYINVCKH